MADLDVTDVLLDPLFADTLHVERRKQVVNGKGRTTTEVTIIDPAPVGVVLPQSDAPMVRGPDQQHLPRLLQIHTPFRLRGMGKDPATGDEYQPDQIRWNSDLYVVNTVQDFSRYGSGWGQADCSSIAPQDSVPT